MNKEINLTRYAGLHVNSRKICCISVENLLQVRSNDPVFDENDIIQYQTAVLTKNCLMVILMICKMIILLSILKIKVCCQMSYSYVSTVKFQNILFTKTISWLHLRLFVATCCVGIKFLGTLKKDTKFLESTFQLQRFCEDYQDQRVSNHNGNTTRRCQQRCVEVKQQEKMRFLLMVSTVCFVGASKSFGLIKKIDFYYQERFHVLKTTSKMTSKLFLRKYYFCLVIICSFFFSITIPSLQVSFNSIFYFYRSALLKWK